MRALVHGVDVATSGCRDQCMWTKQQMGRRLKSESKSSDWGKSRSEKTKFLPSKDGKCTQQRVLNEAKGASSPCDEGTRWER